MKKNFKRKKFYSKKKFLTIEIYILNKFISSLSDAKQNTMIFWKKNNEFKNTKTLFDLVEEDKDSDDKNSKRYKGPVIAATESNALIRNLKRTTQDIRDNIRQK